MHKILVLTLYYVYAALLFIKFLDSEKGTLWYLQ